MALPQRIYRRTAVGSRMVTTPDRTCPLEHQRILTLIDRDTHTDVIRGSLRQFSDTLLADWLAEMEELGYLSSTLAENMQNLGLTDLFGSPRSTPAPLVQEDRRQIERQTKVAASRLDETGTFLFAHRIKNREPLRKTPGEISVLIVEDDPDQAALADMRVSMGGYSVRLAATQSALRQEFFAGRLPDIVLLDIVLPDGDGFEILAAMRGHPQLAMLPVIMLTAIAGKDNVRRGLELGADGYVTKPYSKKIVVETISAVLRHA